MMHAGTLRSQTGQPQYVQVLMPVTDYQAMTHSPSMQHASIPSDVAVFSQPVHRPSPPTVYGIQNRGVQNYLPIAERRELAPEEREDVKKGLSQWWPKIGAGYSTPMSELLASPTKSALLAAAVPGVPALFIGAAAAGLLGAAICGGPLALLVGLPVYFTRRQQNENILDLLHRLPPNATKRDMLADPVYQADLNRAAMQMAAINGNLMAGAAAGSAFRSAGVRGR